MKSPYGIGRSCRTPPTRTQAPSGRSASYPAIVGAGLGTGPSGAVVGALATRLVPGAVVRWAFVGYVALTIVDLLLRPGFLRPRVRSQASDDASGDVPVSVPGDAPVSVPGDHPRSLPALLGAPVGAVAAFLGVGGSVMTVPALRRAGHTMQVATALANPLTLVIALPAAAVSLGGAGLATAPDAHLHLLGLVDAVAAAALLLGALPVIAVLRRRPPRIPDRIHAWTYIGLLAVVAVAMLLSGGQA